MAGYSTEPKHPVQVSEIASIYKWDVVVAFDIGTSYSGYAYSDKKEIKTNSVTLNEWTGNLPIDTKAKAPTTILCNPDKTFHSFGHDAERFYAEQASNKAHAKWYRFRNFKMALYHEKDIGETFKIQDDRKSTSMPAIDLFAYTIRSLKSHFEEAIRDRGITAEAENTLHVITVPAIWPESAKQFMKKAGLKAGIPEHQILLALEPEAAALFCKTLEDHTLTSDFSPETKYMVLDMGGGTVDLVVHKILENGSLVEVYKASGGDWGGNIIDAEFVAFVKKVFENDKCIEELWNLAPEDALDFERDFEAKKRQLNNSPSGKIRLALPARLQGFSNKLVEDPSKKKSITFAHMYVQNEEFKQFFSIVRDRIISLLENVLKETEKIDLVLLVGGLSCSKYIFQEIKQHPSFSKIKFISPKDPGLVVLKGAVLFGHNPQAVTARICRYTYGIGVLKDFDERIHPKSKYAIVDGDKVCQDILDVLVYEGDIVHYDETMMYTSHSSHRQRNQKNALIKKELYQARGVVKGQLAFVTDDGVESIGKIINHPPEGGWSDVVNFETKFYFGQTNIRIEDYDITNKVQIKCEFELGEYKTGVAP